jgi:Peptidase family M28/PA domain
MYFTGHPSSKLKVNPDGSEEVQKETDLIIPENVCKMKKLFLVITVCWGMMNISYAQSQKEVGLQAITKDAIKGQLEFLSSDLMEGRATATRGEYLAGDYIASMFRVYGIQPYGDRESQRGGRGSMQFRRSTAGSFPLSSLPRTYFQNMNMIEYGPGAEQEFSVITRGLSGESSAQFKYRTDYTVRTGTVGRSALAPVVFAGYGLTSEKNGYDDYKKLDVKGKVVLMVSGFPGYKNPNSEAYKKFRPEGRFAEFSVERNKISHAQKLGAAAVIQVRQGEDPSGDWVTNQIYSVKGPYYENDTPISTGDKRMTLMEDTVESTVPVFTISKRVLSQLLEGTGEDLETFDKNACDKMTPASVVLNGKFLQFRTSVESRIVKSRNVLGYIEGEKKNEVVIVGGHYDHLGKIEGWIFNGADDNASGTVGVMTIAKAMAASGKKPEKSIIFAAWSGEEKGLLGSHYFVNHIPDSLKVAVYLNYDMISRNEETDSLGNRAQMNYTEAYPGLKDLTVKNLEDYKIKLNLTYRSSKVPGGGSDHAPFASAGIPIFYFEAAMHPDYHLPSDEVGKINWDKMANIVRTGFLDVWELANGNSYLTPAPEK